MEYLYMLDTSYREPKLDWITEEYFKKTYLCQPSTIDNLKKSIKVTLYDKGYETLPEFEELCEDKEQKFVFDFTIFYFANKLGDYVKDCTKYIDGQAPIYELKELAKQHRAELIYSAIIPLNSFVSISDIVDRGLLEKLTNERNLDKRKTIVEQTFFNRETFKFEIKPN